MQKHINILPCSSAQAKLNKKDEVRRKVNSAKRLLRVVEKTPKVQESQLSSSEPEEPRRAAGAWLKLVNNCAFFHLSLQCFKLKMRACCVYFEENSLTAVFVTSVSVMQKQALLVSRKATSKGQETKSVFFVLF